MSPDSGGTVPPAVCLYVTVGVGGHFVAARTMLGACRCHVRRLRVITTVFINNVVFYVTSEHLDVNHDCL